MQHTRIRLENDRGDEIRIEAGETEFNDDRWRYRIVTDGDCEPEEGRYSTSDELFSFIESYLKQKLAKGFQLVKYKIDGLDIDYLAGLTEGEES